MAKTIANVLTGVAALSIRYPNDAIAEWSEPGYLFLPQSAKLLKTGSGDAGSTHVQFIPPTGITFLNAMATPGDYGFAYYNQVLGAIANWGQMELRFEDPNSRGWVEVTSMPLQSRDGNGAFADLPMTAAGIDTMYGGIGENEVSFFAAGLVGWNEIRDDVDGQIEVTDPDDWILERVRVELWEPTPARYCYIGQVRIGGVNYEVTPGGSAPGMSLGSPFTEIGYTEDGVTVEYTADTAEIEVEEETFPIDEVLIKESCIVTCTMAESSLYNIDKAMAGSVLSGNVLTLGGGVIKTMNIKIEGTAPGGYLASILMPKVVASGAVGMPYKKGEKTVIPLTLKALKSTGVPAVTIVYNEA